MAHGLRTLQHWNQWLSQSFLGTSVLEAESAMLTQLLARHYGKHAVLLGVPHQYDLLRSTLIPCHSLLSPLIMTNKIPGFIEGDFHDLPILTGSMDLVLLPHALEFVDYPRQLLAEACRIVKPEGLIVICGFNPYSAWGIKKQLTKQRVAPWTGHFMHANKIRKWLHLADFDIEKQESALFRPPVNSQAMYQKLHFLERCGKKCFSGLGGVYMIVARAKVVPLTPIRMKWKQQLNGIRISTTISGHIAQNSK